jgi:hypothetical protein
MSFYEPFKLRFPAWADWFALAFMALAAPVIAAFIHSWCIYHGGYRLYNAEIGGAFFHGREAVDNPGVGMIIAMIGACGVPAIPTFLVLLAFRRWTFLRWLVWCGFIVLWTWLYFKMEFAYY